MYLVFVFFLLSQFGHRMPFFSQYYPCKSSQKEIEKEYILKSLFNKLLTENRKKNVIIND